MYDPVDAVMSVMEAAFDPAFGEAWNRRQVTDSLVFANTHLQIAGDPPENVQGFLLSRNAVDEEELLLIAVHPRHRGKGVGEKLMQRFIEAARDRRVRRVFLEMRAGNPAERLYRQFGFEQIGLRKDYYRRAKDSPLDAVTFALTIA
jgi:[ribosomal protein S18]-alanine N-acetyltransferase